MTNWRASSPTRPSIRMRSTCATATSRRRRASPREWTSRSRWSKRISAASSRSKSRDGSCCSSRRPGGQSQFSTQLRSQSAERAPIRELQTWIVEHPTDDLSVGDLASRVAMSPRHFARGVHARNRRDPRRLRRGHTRRARAGACSRKRRLGSRRGRPRPRLRLRRDAAPRLPPHARCRTQRLSRPIPTTRLETWPLRRLPDHRDEFHHANRHPARIPTSPPSTPSARTRCCRTSRTWRSCSSPSEAGEYRTDDTARSASSPTRALRRRHRARRVRGAGRLRHPRLMADDGTVLDWIRAVHETTTWTTSVCTGSLLLGAAGVLDGLDATTHWASYDLLASTRRRARRPSASSSGARSSPPPACRRASTWRCTLAAEHRRRRRRQGDPARRSSTTRNRRSTAARRPRPRPSWSSCSAPSPTSGRRRSPDVPVSQRVRTVRPSGGRCRRRRRPRSNSGRTTARRAPNRTTRDAHQADRPACVSPTTPAAAVRRRARGLAR